MAAAWLTRVDQRLAAAKAAISAGNMLEARSILESLPPRDDVLLSLADLYLRLGTPTLAAQTLRRLSSAGADSFDAERAAGQILAASGRSRAALAQFRTLAKHWPDHPDAHRWLAATAFDLGLHAEASKHAALVVKLDPHDYRPHRLLALIAKERGELEGSLLHYRQAATLDGADETLITEAAQVAYEANQYQFAIGFLDSPAVANSDRAAAIRANCLIALGQTESAGQILERLLRQNAAEDFWALWGRGQLAAQLGNYPQAVHDLQRAVDVDPGHWPAREKLAFVLGKLGRRDDAEREHSSAANIRELMVQLAAATRLAAQHPDDPQPRQSAADICRRLGQSKSSARWLEAAQACKAKR